MIVTETNRNLKKHLETKPARAQDKSSFKPTTAVEVRKMFGLLLWMGLVKMPKIKDYWSKNNLYVNAIAPAIFTRDRFHVLLRFLHFENEENASKDRLYKIRPLTDKLISLFQTNNAPDENIVIDETVVSFRGRIIFRQYLPGKSHKYGVKLYKLCDVEGYTFNFSIFAGKVNEFNTSTPHTEEVVMNLMMPYLDRGHTLATDNYYTSVPLCKKLNKRKTHLVGTLRKNRRDLPKFIIKKSLKRGEATARYHRGICITKWCDKRDVLILSSKHKLKFTTTGKKDRRTHADITKPTAITDYNKMKIGIDISDQLTSYYTVLRKTIRWYHKVAIQLICGTSVVNAFILYKRNVDSRMSLQNFTEELVFSLTGVPRKNVNRKLSSRNHFFDETEDRPGQRRKRNRCRLCYRKKVAQNGRNYARKNTPQISTFCRVCPDKPFLCIKCFEEFHK